MRDDDWFTLFAPVEGPLFDEAAPLKVVEHVRSGPSKRLLVFVVATAGVFLASPAAALAHSLSLDNDPNRPLWKYLWFGFLHMATGWDHLLFILGVVLIAGGVGTAAKLISLFVAGHSITLLIATLAGWQLDPTLVDVVIALSVVYVGVRGIAGRPANLRLDWRGRLRVRSRARPRSVHPPPRPWAAR